MVSRPAAPHLHCVYPLPHVRMHRLLAQLRLRGQVVVPHVVLLMRRIRLLPESARWLKKKGHETLTDTCHTLKSPRHLPSKEVMRFNRDP